ncbi:MAG: hypothetical protein Q4G44_06315 [Alcaligenaceae bacterium]|nr:hypothetical protein [Alcaligenaceae bacterium]
MSENQVDPTQNTTESTDNDVLNAVPKKTIFSNGSFVIALIVFALFIALITWSVSFLSMFFGAVGALIMAAKGCLTNDTELRFVHTGSDCCRLSDENFAYLAIRAVIGMLTGTALYLIAFQNVAAPWAAIAALSMFGGLVFDRLIFGRKQA